MANHMHTERTTGERGFSLLEVTLLIAAVVIIAAALTPALLRTIHDQRQRAARTEMEALHRAIVGSDADGTYGYVGDMGRMPFALSELMLRESQPFFILSELNGVGTGWNGPYVNIGTDANDYALDPWGVPYDIGVVGQGQIRSAGPNGLFDDADDIVVPASPVTAWGTVLVSVKGHEGDLVHTDPDGCIVTLHFSNSGEPATVLDETVPFSFTDVHRGPHAIDVSCPRLDGGVANETAIAVVRGAGAQQVVEVHVALGEDLSAAPGTSEESGSANSEQATSGADDALTNGQR